MRYANSLSTLAIKDPVTSVIIPRISWSTTVFRARSRSVPPLIASTTEFQAIFCSQVNVLLCISAIRLSLKASIPNRLSKAHDIPLPKKRKGGSRKKLFNDRMAISSVRSCNVILISYYSRPVAAYRKYPIISSSNVLGKAV